MDDISSFFGLDTLEIEPTNSQFSNEDIMGAFSTEINIMDAFSSDVVSLDVEQDLKPIVKPVKPVKTVKPVISKISKGTLKRKVTGNGEFVSELSKKRKTMEDVGVPLRITSVPRKLKVLGSETYVLGLNVSNRDVPSSAARRLCQIICAMGDWEKYSRFFDKVPAIISTLRNQCVQEMNDNGLDVETNGDFLRATVQRALCTEGRPDDYMFSPLSRYILQDKYVTSGMTYTIIQSLCGSICKYNKRIGVEFPELSYSKIGGSRVSNTVFHVKK